MNENLHQRPSVAPARRAVLLGLGVATASASAGAVGAAAAPRHQAGEHHHRDDSGDPGRERDHDRGMRQSYRPKYHFSVPDSWKNDPQRPIYVDGEYLYYYLYNADYLDGGAGTAWRLATTTDHVQFRDRGVAIEKNTNGNGDLWSGSVVVDHEGTAGYGRGAVIAIVTQAPHGRQAQYLWYSVDGGRSFSAGGTDPVLANPGVDDYRDPKVIWDADRSRWVLLNAEGDRIGVYVSPDLHHWQPVSRFERSDIGLLECPDLFRMRAEDGSEHWILGVSANGKARGLPATYAYWVGEFDGTVFTPAVEEPQWLDWGFDFYGAVTYAHHDHHGNVNPTRRHAIGWANFWDYPHNAPSIVTDGYNGDDMIVRDLRLVASGGSYALASRPTAGLQDHLRRRHELRDIEVAGTYDLPVRARAYRLTCELHWDPADPPENLGLEVCRAPGGGRHVAVGVYAAGGYAYVNRRPTFNPTGGESQTPVNVSSGRMKMDVLVDHSSVEVFFGDGTSVHSHRVYPPAGDNRIRLYSHGGLATFTDLEVAEPGAH